MGSLTPGATYIYERVDDVVYSREVGTNDRQPIGWKWPPGSKETRNTLDQIRDDKLWGDIRRSASSNPALQKALDHAILIYRLSKDSPL